jgi:hypothetical protein
MDGHYYATEGDTIELRGVCQWGGLKGLGALGGWNATVRIRALIVPGDNAPADLLPAEMAVIDAATLDPDAGTVEVYQKVTVTNPGDGEVIFRLTNPIGDGKTFPDPPRERSILHIQPAR